jgi:tRNA (guanine26-N2/guanine27-N2)-dimethyltransferase
MEIVSEGKARIITANAFYNPKMKRLRDISVALLRATMNPRFAVLDSTAATGIRGIRYLLEADAGKAVFLEINSSAYATLLSNIKLNGVEAKAEAKNTSIQEFANTSNERFDAIDLDPFGTPAPYIFDLLKLAKDNTLFMVTATDTATLCGAEAHACLRLYAAKPMHGKLCHEASIRILLAFLARLAAQFNFGIEPLLSLAELHYVRVFVKLKRGAQKALESVKEIGLASLCRKCHSYYLAKLFSNEKIAYTCNFCGSSTEVFGPLWLGSITNKQVLGKVASLLEGKTAASINAIASELEVPFFYSLDEITSYLGIGSVPLDKVISELKEKGVSVSKTAFCTNCIKADAKVDAIIDAVKKANGSVIHKV